MKNPQETFESLKKYIEKKHIWAFLSVVITGLLTHLPIMLSDIPNHDGLDSLYHNQNIISSGRWFLSVACGFSTYFSLPWIIGIISLLFLGLAAALLVDLLEIKNIYATVLISSMLVTFPVLCSNFAYVFTMDGYMLAILLAVLSVYLCNKGKLGWLFGAVALAFSMGIYQAYLSLAILICLYKVMIYFVEEEPLEALKKSSKMLYMGIVGVGLYYLILQIMLKIQGKTLGNYQRTSDMAAGVGLFDTLKKMYVQFISFSLKGRILFNNIYSAVGLGLLIILAVVVFVSWAVKNKIWRKPVAVGVIFMVLVLLPLMTNIILVISPDVTYHLLMKYQYVMLPVIMIAVIDRYMTCSIEEWGLLIAAFVITFNFALTDNVGYFNLEKKYEKTYAYCVRLLDRIENTEGYYQGIPVAMIGVVSDEQYPTTDLTEAFTRGMVGIDGDILLYTGENYRLFIQNYLGATLNIVDTSYMEEIYYSDEYTQMDSFPGPTSVKLVDGMIYVKTENYNRN